MSETTEKAAEWWSDPDRDVPGTQWLQIPGAVENMNRRATGDPEMDWITHSAGLLAKFTKPIKALSLGCGFGVIERVLRRSDYCQLIHGVDVAEGAIVVMSDVIVNHSVGRPYFKTIDRPPSSSLRSIVTGTAAATGIACMVGACVLREPCTKMALPDPDLLYLGCGR